MGAGFGQKFMGICQGWQGANRSQNWMTGIAQQSGKWSEKSGAAQGGHWEGDFKNAKSAQCKQIFARH